MRIKEGESVLTPQQPLTHEQTTQIMRMGERLTMKMYGKPDPSNGYQPGGVLPTK